jgi:hypothetical protein
VTRNKVKIVLFLLPLFLLVIGFLVAKVKKPQAASLTNVSATLSNPRLSFYGAVNGGTSAGVSVINIKTSGNYGDKNTNHLFPNDSVAVGPNGNLTVASIVDSDTFTLSSPLLVSADDGAAIYSTQSGVLTVSFTLTNQIPANGYVQVLIPDPPTNGNDGAPDTADSVANNGFDLNGMTTANITTSGGTGCTWSTETLTEGSGSSHKYKVKTTTACTGGTITIEIGDNNIGLVNPAPVYSGHTQGTADVYRINVATYTGDPDAGGSLIDSGYGVAAPVEAVLVSATVEESLSFVVDAVNSGTTACGQIIDVTTTATSVPWGTLNVPNTFKEAAHTLTVSTNANNGYTVKIEENDQMGLNGKTCTGANAGESDGCIQDTTCNASGCTETTSQDWTAANAYRGLGYSLANISGSDAAFTYNESGRTFSAKQIADQEASETKQTIMSNSGPVDSKQIYVCYRIAISGTQPAGYYFNKVKYTATATF